MAVFKCKMCGGTLEINDNSTVAICQFCETAQTLPSKNDEVIANLFNRANNMRLKSEFDKAAQIYEKILNEDNSDAEAHWGMVLCKYGIEYVEDPATYKRIPTCHRTQYESVLTDIDYLSALANSDGESKAIYKAQAEEISALQKDILAIVKNEKPFDVFICYKETDENGKRTVDSVLANDIYYQLTQEGLKVFYAAITLEDKLGLEYEPYIFAALNSAKVMLAVGTKPEYFDAVWVRNEWSRYLKIMKNDRSKLLIPCYRDMDAYDLPEEFSHLQAQDMSKIGFVNDIVRGIKKIAAPSQAEEVKETVVVNQASGNTDALLKRAFMALEDGEFERADDFCEQALNIDPENAEAYLVKLMADLKIVNRADLKTSDKPFGDNNNYKKVLRFGDDALKTEIEDYCLLAARRIENIRLENIYNSAYGKMTNAVSWEDYDEAAKAFESIIHYKDSSMLAETCCENAKELLDSIDMSELYEIACQMMRSARYKSALEAFIDLKDYKDSREKAEECKEMAYNAACQMIDEEYYIHASEIFETIIDYKDSREKVELCKNGADSVDKADKRMLLFFIAVICIITFILFLLYLI